MDSQSNAQSPSVDQRGFSLSITAADISFNDQAEDRLLAEEGYDPFDALTYLQLAIAEGLSPGLPRFERLDRSHRAIAVLRGEHLKKGNASLDDYPLLYEIAWRVHELQVAGNTKPDVQPIARSVLEALPATDRRRAATLDANSRRLVRKFKKDRQLLLARVNAEGDPDRMEALRELLQLITAMCCLGIPASGHAIQPVIRGRT